MILRNAPVIVGFAVLVVVAVGLVLHRRNDLRFAASIPAGETANYAPGTYNETIVTTDGRTRTYTLAVPNNYSTSQKYPLVVLLHGGYGTGPNMLQQTQFAAVAQAEGLIIVAPDGVDQHWNNGSGLWNPHIDDVSFINQLLTKLKSQLSIDITRIYAAGLSNGGSMTTWLAFKLPKIWAAIAVAGSNMLANIVPARNPPPIPFVGIHGTADPLNPFDGGEVASGQGDVESSAWTMNYWASINGCNLTPDIAHIPPTVNDGTSVDQYTYSNRTGQIAVAYYVVRGMGHQWPPSQVLSDVAGPTSHNINATDVILDFFSRHWRQQQSSARVLPILIMSAVKNLHFRRD